MYSIKRLTVVLSILLIAPIARAQDNALVGTGSTLAYPFITKIIEDYSRTNRVNVNYQSIGSAEGLAQLKGNTIDFGVSDIPGVNSNSVLYIPIAICPVAIAYNLPGVKATLKLSHTVLADIFLKRITKWNDAQIVKLNPGVKLPSMPIQIVDRAEGSGTAYIFNNYLRKVYPGWKAGSIKAKLTSKTNQGNAGWVKLTPGTIAYIGLAYAKQYQLPYAAIQNKSGNYVKAGDASYPIHGLTYAVVYKEQNYSSRPIDRIKQLTKLLNYIIHSGQKEVQPLGYQSLSPELVKEAEKALRLVTYNAKPLQK
ncbi:MAG: phosphate ABC transporter substrate-binding protein PstS [Sphingobacteriaceae bacterium]|nr:MAG: phosphate ABC transporter substrate-binding protein PstS [Sphingobacteriaceae bacterium]